MGAEQVHIHSVGNLYMAELLRQMLSEHEITAFIVNKMDSFYKFGDIELYVHRDSVIRAKKLINEFETR